MVPTPKRFPIALSFPGEHRAYVGQVADALAHELGRRAVLYDTFHEGEFARPNLDTHLQKLYHSDSELSAVFLCKEYDTSDWCGLEWRAIRDRIKQGDDASIMLLRFDDAEVPGVYSIDGYVDISDRPAEVIARLVLDRYDSLREQASIPRTPRPPKPTSSKVAVSRLRHSAAHLLGREEEMTQLDEAWNNPETRVVTLVAWGGVGKTSLVAEWVATLAARDYDGARYFDWSFYSQGTREKGGPSSDAFVAAALRFFGDSEMAESLTSAWNKGARLAELAAAEPTLLVLDGLEPLQHPPGPLSGQLQDQAVIALLKGLASKNSGLCVVTTRESVVDLRAFRKTTAPEWSLRRLSKPAGIALLRRLGVHGSEAEFEALVEEVRGHALTLSLLGEYLALAHGGDIRKRDEVALADADSETQSGGHAFRAMDAYVAWLVEGGKRGARQLAVLRLLGLFDRPASDDCIRALRAEPVIEGLTEPLVGLLEVDWNLTVRALADGRLIARPEPDDTTLDAHPLIREYFASALRDHQPDTWRQAHSRLFDHLQEITEYQPDTLEDLQPLYQAVRHGCESGRHQEARAKVYRDRILRGSEAYSTFQLGAIGADLGAVACFFETHWSRLAPNLSKAEQAWLLNEAAYSLRALGRLTEAVEPMRVGLENRVSLEDWKNAAASASNLSALELNLGNVAAAVGDGEQAVVFADRTGDAFERFADRTVLAHALHQKGLMEKALALFREAEAIQVKSRPSEPVLYSLQGFRYCEALLADTERAAWWTGVVRVGPGSRPGIVSADDLLEINREAKERATQALAIAVENNWILDIALGHLTFGCSQLYWSVLGCSNESDSQPGSVPHVAHNEIDRAVDGLRRAGTRHHFPLGLLARAFRRTVTGDPNGARADLDEAWEIAERGPMPLFMADIHLHRARLFRDRTALAEARRLIEKHGYGRRIPELEDAESVADSWL